MENKAITIDAIINAPIDKVWQYWTEPQHITKWCQASEDWEAPFAENDIKTGGRFKTTMAAKDKSSSFDFAGTYTEVLPHQTIKYTMDDNRKVDIVFTPTSDGVKITETFEMEHENTEELQRSGWQAILDSFKKYTETH